MASSSSSSLTVANRDGSSSASEDEAVMSVTRAYAQDALLQFQSGKFDQCLTALSECLKRKPNDPKIFHNIGLSEFYRDGCSHPKRLLDVLNDVKKRSEELARASAEQVESGSNIGGSRGSSTMGHPFSAVYMDEFDTYVATLNIAVIWFHLHEYAKALSVVEPLFQNRGPIDEKTALNICLLLLDVGLACHDATKSADVLVYLEKAFGVSCMNQGDSGSTVLQQPANPVAKSPSLPTNSSAADGPNLDSDANALESEETGEYDGAVFDMDVAQPTALLSSNDLSRNPVDISVSSVYLKLKMQLFKVRFLLLTRNLKQAKREVKHAMNIARGRDSSMALLLKSQLEYARGNYRKAIKLLMASSNRTDARISSMINNNLGCIYYQLGKYHTASVFFSNALLNCSSLRKDRPINLLTFSQDNSLLIIYNSGMQYLACGKPLLAARCFQKAGLVFYNRPLLWLRFAECCLMALEKGLLETTLASSEVRVYVIGNGKWRQLVMEDGVSKNGNSGSFERGDLFLGSDQQPKLSMSLARQCLSNALYLLNCSEVCFSGFPESAFSQNPGLCGSPVLNCKGLVNNPTRPGFDGAVASPVMPAANPTVVASSPSSLPGNSTPNKSTNTRRNGASKISPEALIAIIVGDALVLVFVSLLLYCYFLRNFSSKMRQGKSSSKLLESEKIVYSSSPYSAQPGTERGQMVFFEGVKRFELEDLLRASAEMLGKGGFGTAYKAVLDDGNVVAVKRLKDAQIGGKREFEQHMAVLGRLSHPNIVSLRAYYFAREEKLLVYDYMSNGSLFWLLHGNRGPGRTPLDWTTRLKIAAGAARGLACIHNSCSPLKLTHGNIKSTNILLDKTGNARVSDFGLSVFVPPPPATSSAPRSCGYRAPETLDGRKLTQKSDVYAFGVLLLELLTGKCPSVVDSGGPGGGYGGLVDLPRWVQSVVREEWTAEVFDLELMRYKDIEEEMVGLLQIAMACTAASPDQRPRMSQVVKMIDEIQGVVGSPSHEAFDSMSESPSLSEDTCGASQ